MQLLAYRKVADYDAWRREFDDDGEARSSAGLTLLQMWRDADDGTRVWMLYEVSDRGRATEYLDGLGKLHADKGGASETAHHFLRTA